MQNENKLETKRGSGESLLLLVLSFILAVAMLAPFLFDNAELAW